MLVHGTHIQTSMSPKGFFVCDAIIELATDGG